MFKTILQPLIEFYELREPREQIILLFGIPILVTLLFYIAIWQPLQTKNTKLQNTLTQEKSFTEWFEQQNSSLADKATTFDWSSNNLPTVIETTLRENNLNPWKKRIFQNQKEETVITFEEIPYDKLSRWIRILNSQYQVVFRSANFTAVKTQGTIDVKLTLATTHDTSANTQSPFNR
jgi:type II secretory pathway component PulM